MAPLWYIHYLKMCAFEEGKCQISKEFAGLLIPTTRGPRYLTYNEITFQACCVVKAHWFAAAMATQLSKVWVLREKQKVYSASFSMSGIWGQCYTCVIDCSSLTAVTQPRSIENPKQNGKDFIKHGCFINFLNQVMPCWTFTYPEGDKKKAELKKQNQHFVVGVDTNPGEEHVLCDVTSVQFRCEKQTWKL